MNDILDTSDPVLLRVDRKLREDYLAAWNAYASTCTTGGTPEQRTSAYEAARKLEERLNAAVVVAASELKRKKAKAVRG